MSKVEGQFGKHTERRLRKSSTFDFEPSDLRPSFKSAFTMVELLVVLAIIAVLTTISIPTIDAMTSPKHALRKEGRQVMQLMTEARTAAMSRKMQMDLRIDPETREVRMIEARAFRSLAVDDFSLQLNSTETNRYEKMVVLEEAYTLDCFTADQIRISDEEDDGFEEAEYSEINEEESTDQLAVSFMHFGGSSGGGITLEREGMRLHIAADILTGRPRVVRLTSESKRSKVP